MQRSIKYEVLQILQWCGLNLIFCDDKLTYKNCKITEVQLNVEAFTVYETLELDTVDRRIESICRQKWRSSCYMYAVKNFASCQTGKYENMHFLLKWGQTGMVTCMKIKVKLFADDIQNYFAQNVVMYREMS